MFHAPDMKKDGPKTALVLLNKLATPGQRAPKKGNTTTKEPAKGDWALSGIQ